MKKTISSAVLFLALAGNIIAQNGTQIEYKISSSAAGVSGTMKSFYSGQNFRSEMKIVVPQIPGGELSKVSIIKSTEPAKIYALDNSSKTYTTSEVKSGNTGATDNNATVKIIGKEKVGKYNCTHAQVTQNADVSDYWITTEIADYDKYRQTNNNNKYMEMGPALNALSKNGLNGFPVKTVSKDARGTVITAELVTLEKKELAASLFEIPADYKPAGKSGAPAAPVIDAAKLQNMTPEERAKYVEELKKQYGAQGGNK